MSSDSHRGTFVCVHVWNQIEVVCCKMSNNSWLGFILWDSLDCHVGPMWPNFYMHLERCQCCPMLQQCPACPSKHILCESLELTLRKQTMHCQIQWFTSRDLQSMAGTPSHPGKYSWAYPKHWITFWLSKMPQHPDKHLKLLQRQTAGWTAMHCEMLLIPDHSPDRLNTGFIADWLSTRSAAHSNFHDASNQRV